LIFCPNFDFSEQKSLNFRIDCITWRTSYNILMLMTLVPPSIWRCEYILVNWHGNYRIVVLQWMLNIFFKFFCYEI
jgi:hypothetical protein